MFVKKILYRFYHLFKKCIFTGNLFTHNANDLVSQIDTRMKNTFVWIFFHVGFIIQSSYLGIFKSTTYLLTKKYANDLLNFAYLYLCSRMRKYFSIIKSMKVSSSLKKDSKNFTM